MLQRYRDQISDTGKNFWNRREYKWCFRTGNRRNMLDYLIMMIYLVKRSFEVTKALQKKYDILYTDEDWSVR